MGPERWQTQSEGTDGFLETPALEMAAQALARSAAAAGETGTANLRSLPAAIGRYRIVRLLGEGGMGTVAVFLALVAGVAASTSQAIRANRAGQAALLERDRAAAARQTATEERDRALRAERAATNERNRAISAETQALQQRNRALTEKQRADEESATAKAVDDFLRNDLLAQAGARAQARPDTNPDPDLKVRTALDRAAAGITGKFNGRPLVEAAIRQTIGRTYLDLGIYP
jgi:hypothetical protein